MKKKSATHPASFSPRALIAFLLCSAAACSMLIPIRSGLAFPHSQAPSNAAQRSLTFEERVSYQRAIEDAYWRHRIWPKENSSPKPSLDAVMSQRKLRRKSQSIYASRRHWRITGNDRLQPSSYKLKWIAWQSIPNSPRYCRNSLKHWGTIPL